MMKFTCQPMLPFLLLLVIPLKTIGEQINHRKDYLNRLQMKAKIKSMLRSSMSNYFDPATFILELNIGFPDVINEKHHLPEMAEDIDIAELPGVPFIRIPRLSVTEIDVSFPKESNPDVMQAIEKICVNIHADTVYGDKDLDFMRMLTAMVLQINENAGDEINVFRIAMPGRPFPDRRPSQPGEPGYTSAIESEWDPVGFETPPATPGNNTADNPLPRMTWLAIAVFIASMLLLLLTLFVKKWRRLTKEESPRSDVNDEKTCSTSSKPQKVSLDETTMKTVTAINGDRNIHKNYMFINACFLERTNDLALLFENWITRNEPEGANRIARTINMLDPRYLKLFKGLIGEYCYSVIEKAMQDPDNQYLEIDNEVLGKLSAELRSYLHPNVSSKISELHFLSYMDNDALLNLSNSLEPNELSVLINYLPDEKVSRVFEEIGPATTARVLKFNARKRHVGFKKVSCLAEKCFDFFLEQKAGKEYNSMNLGRIAGLLEKLCIEKQEQFLDSIRENDPDLHQTIYSRIFTWKKLAGMEPRVLKAALAKTDSRTLAFALADDETSMKQKMLSLRSNREQLLINDLMKEAAKEPVEKKEKAKQILLKNIREHVKSELEA